MTALLKAYSIFLLLSFAGFANSKQISIEDVQEGPCISPPVDENFDLLWLANYAEWYYPIWSKYELYKWTVAISGYNIRNVTQDMALRSCMILYVGGDAGATQTAFLGTKKTTFDSSIADHGIFDWTETRSDGTAGYKGRTYITLTDNDKYYVSVSCWGKDNQRSYTVHSNVKTLDPRTKSKIMTHLAKLGFDVKNNWVEMTYDDCIDLSNPEKRKYPQQDSEYDLNEFPPDSSNLSPQFENSNGTGGGSNNPSGGNNSNAGNNPGNNQPGGNNNNQGNNFGNNQGNNQFGNNQGNNNFGNNQGNNQFGNNQNQGNNQFGNNQNQGNNQFGNNQGNRFGNQGNNQFGNNQGNNQFGNNQGNRFGNNQGNRFGNNQGNNQFGNQGNRFGNNQGNNQYQDNGFGNNQGNDQFGNGNDQSGNNNQAQRNPDGMNLFFDIFRSKIAFFQNLFQNVLRTLVRFVSRAIGSLGLGGLGNILGSLG